MKLVKYIESCNLRPDATREDIERLCDDAVKYGFPVIYFFDPKWVPLAVERLRGTGVKVGGGAMKEGSERAGMMINLEALRSGDLDLVKREIAELVQAVKGVNPEATVEVVLECCEMSDEEKVSAAKLAEEAGADLVATSVYGATVEDVRLLRSVLWPRVKVKASGGIRTGEEAWAMIEAGAERIGTSYAVEVMCTQPAKYLYPQGIPRRHTKAGRE